ncbi:TonB-dependent receptor domain-containing protein [Gayadomonas joobiniege]|uniref:TonB-dependent receptor domain-containing protein n=1 Tax=Gayadomonas joobiniege TaxID=1234606 RepID=UPI0003804006|nr:TonB-dependent receptor [Gayadomonas joobiniege]
MQTLFFRSACSLAVTAALTFSNNAVAATDDAEKKPAKKKMAETIIVTGSSSATRTELESSVAITLIDEADLIRKAPRSTADVLELIPGFVVEDTGGEVSNNYLVRGLPGGSQRFVQILEDGLPVKYSNGLVDAIVKYDVTMDRVEALRGGTSGIVTVQGSGAAVNFISRRIADEAEGTIRFTGSDYNTQKLELYYGAPLGANWYTSVGGYYRVSDAVRDTEFTADRGGQMKFRLERRDAEGKFGFTAKIVDEHNTFLLPTPFKNFNDPQAIAGFDALEGTLLSADNSYMIGRTTENSGAPSVVTHDLTEGFATEATQLGFYLERYIGDEFKLNVNSRYIDHKFVANAVFSEGNSSLVPAVDRIDPSKYDDVQAMLDRFSSDGAVRAGLQEVSSGYLYSDSELATLNQNGLLVNGISRSPWDTTQEFVSDIKLTWETDNNALSAGILYFDTRFERGEAGMNTFLSEVTNNPSRLDLVALNDDNEVVGYLTENGVLSYGAWGESAAHENRRSTSFYVNDEYQVNDDFRLDFGVRYETLEGNSKERQGYSQTEIAGAFDAQGNDTDNIIANNYVIGGTGTTYLTRSGEESDVTWTIGGNYKLDDNTAVYGRYVNAHNMNAFWNDASELKFTELGIRYQNNSLQTSMTLFRSEYSDFSYETGTRGFTDFVRATGAFDITGVEVDLSWQALDVLRFDVVGMFQTGGLSQLEYQEGNLDALGDLLTRVDDLEPPRSPQATYTLSASYSLPDDIGEIYFSTQYMGDRFSDTGNSITLPSYQTIDAGAIWFINQDLTFNINANNLTNEIGLSEGNPRDGFIERPDGSDSDVFLARSIPGRNFVFSLTYDF